MSIQNEAQKKMAELPVHIQHAYSIAWNRSEDSVREFYTSKSKKPLSFSVHHGIANARKLFLNAFMAGKPPAECETEAKSPYV